LSTTPLPPIIHPVAVRTILPLSITALEEPYLITGAGDVIRVYDISSPSDPELVKEVDGHWHVVTMLRLWSRKFVGNDGKARVEPWIVSTSLDGTIRKWRLSGTFFFLRSARHRVLILESDLLTTATTVPVAKLEPVVDPPKPENKFEMTAEEERELAELLDSD
jgi:hypothetical protein